MKVDVGLRKRPTFEEVANIVNKDAYKIDLPSRTYIRWEDTNARVQFENFRDATAEAEMMRARRQAVEAQVVAPPAVSAAPTPPVSTSDASVGTTVGQVTLTGEMVQPKQKLGRK